MSISRQQRRYQERMEAKGKARAPGTSIPSNLGRVNKPVEPGTGLTPERLVACALTDHEGITYHGHRSHSELRASLGRTNVYGSDPSDTYGFWTSHNRFVTRDEAKLIGEISGQTRPQQRELLSSDIDW